MDVLNIALNLLALAGIWAIVELALTIRKTRSTVDTLTKEVTEITQNANEALDQVQPIIKKVDGMVTELEPAVEEIQPLLEKANAAVDVVTVDLASVNDILVDVSSVTDTASNVTSTVSKAANSAVSGVAGVVGKFTSGGNKKSHQRKLGGRGKARAEKLEALEEAAPEVDVVAEEPEASKTYFTY